MLPGMSGYAVCENLREQGNDLPILILSARTLTEDRIRGMDVGADQYLEKPFDLDELLAMVRNLLSRRRARQVARRPARSATNSNSAAPKSISIRSRSPSTARTCG